MTDVSGASASIDWAHLATEIGTLLPLFRWIAAISGLVLVISGLARWGLSERRGDISTGGCIARIVFGVFLLSLQQLIDVGSQTLFGQNAENMLAYHPPSGTAGADIIKVLVLVVHLVGYWAVIKSLWMFARAWDGRETPGPAATHLAGGLVAVNIIVFLHAAAGWIGGSAAGVVNKLFG